MSKKLGNLHSGSLEEGFDDNFLPEKKNLLFIFGTWLIFLPTFYEKLPARLTKLHFVFLAQKFMEWKFFLKEYTFSIVSWFGSKKIESVRDDFRRSRKSAFNVSRRLCRAIRFFEKVLEIQLSSDVYWKLFSKFKKMWQSKLQFTCSDENVFGFVVWIR